MALVGSVSGSNSIVAITGSVIVANRPNATYPSLPGVDAVFFVSGNIAARSPGSPAASPDYTVRGTTVFGGDVVISGTLFGGSPLYIGDQVIARNGLVVSGAMTTTAGLTGSLTKLADGTSYLIAGTNVTITTGSNGAVTIASTGGGGGSNFFTETAAGVIYNSGTVAFTGARTGETITAASDKGTDVVFYFSGSNAGVGTAGSNATLFGGNVITSGSFSIKTASGVIASISNGGVISGSSDLQAGANLTVGGTSTLVGVVSASNDLAVNGGDLTTTSTTFNLVNTSATTVNFAGAATTLEIGAATGTTSINNDLTVDGNTTLGNAVSDTTTVAGSLAVNGTSGAGTNKITSTQTSFDLLNTTVTTLSVAGAATTVNIGAATGTTTVNNDLTVNKNLIVKGDLYISGTTTTIDSTVMEIQDPVIGLGFASGSVAGSLSDRGFIGGLVGENSVAMFWDESADGFTVARTDTTPTAAAVGAAINVVDYQAFRAGKLELGGPTAFVTSSDGSKLTSKGSTIELNPNTGGIVDFQVNGFSYINFKDGGAGNPAVFGAVSNKNLVISGALIRLNAGNNGFQLERHGVPIGVVSGTIGAGAGLRIAAGDTSVAQELTLSGSSVIIGANGGTTTIQGGTLVGNQTTQSVFNTVATTVNFAGAATTLTIGNASGTTTVNSSLVVNGNTTFGNDINTDQVSFANAKVSTTILPSGDRTLDLGSSTARWANIYTGDLHLRNERGDYTLIEEPDFLSIRFNKTGKRYKFLLERVPELDEQS